MIALLPADPRSTAATPSLTRAEWRVVAIALSDAAVARPRRGVIGWLTGTGMARPLADRRLEAIRAFVCEARRRGRHAASLADDLLRLGFSSDQVVALALLSR